MNENASIKEGNITRKFSPVEKLQTNKSGSGNVKWIPESSINTNSLSVIKNGLYFAKDEGYTAYNSVNVNVSPEISPEIETNYKDAINSLDDDSFGSLDDLSKSLNIDLNDPNNLADLEEGLTNEGSIKGIDPETGKIKQISTDSEGNIEEEEIPWAEGEGSYHAVSDVTGSVPISIGNAFAWSGFGRYGGPPDRDWMYYYWLTSDAPIFAYYVGNNFYTHSAASKPVSATWVLYAFSLDGEKELKNSGSVQDATGKTIHGKTVYSIGVSGGTNRGQRGAYPSNAGDTGAPLMSIDDILYTMAYGDITQDVEINPVETHDETFYGTPDISYNGKAYMIPDREPPLQYDSEANLIYQSDGSTTNIYTIEDATTLGLILCVGVMRDG